MKFLKQKYKHQLSSNLDELLIPHPLSSQQALARVHNSYGCYSLILILTLSTTFSTLGCVAYGFAYLQDVQHLNITCTSPTNPVPYSCTAKEVCSNSSVDNFTYQIDIESPHTLRNWAYDYDIFCLAANNKLTWLATSYFIAFLINSVISSVLADKFGRRPVIIAGLILHLVLLVALVSMIWRSYWMLMIVMVGFGIRAPMASHVAAVLQSELGGPGIRSYLTTAIIFFDNVISLLLPIYYYYIGDWRYVMYFNFGVVSLCLILITTIVPQSPRYYASKNQFTKARQVYERLARMSGRKMFYEKLEGEEEIQKMQRQDESNRKILKELTGGNNLFQMIDLDDQDGSSPGTSNSSKRKSSAKKKKKRQFQHLIAVKTVKRKDHCCQMMKPSSPYLYPILFLTFALFCSAVIFYGTIMGMNKLHGSILINGTMIGSADIAAAILCGVLANYFGRVKYYAIAWIIIMFAFSLYFVVSFFQSLYFLTYISILLGKFATTTTFSLCFLILYETFPTSHRTTIAGVISGTARIGAALGPVMISYLNNYFMFIFVGMGFMCLLGTIKLKETKGKAMRDLIQQDEENKSIK